MKTSDHDQAAVEHGAAHFQRRIEHHVERGARIRQCPVQAQAPDDVLDVDDGVVDDLAERDDEAGEHHRVQRPAAIVQQNARRQQRQRDRDAADQRRPPVGEEHEQDRG